MNKKITIFELVICCVIVAILAFSASCFILRGAFFGASGAGMSGIYDKLTMIDDYVRSNYVGTIDEQELETDTVCGYMMGLNDPYAAYYSTDEWKQQQQRLNGELVGIGITVQQHPSGYPSVVSIEERSPASQAGMQVGDLVVAVDGTDLGGKSLDDAVNLIQGEEHTELQLVYRRGGADHQVSLTRELFEMTEISYQLDGEIGYIKIHSFAASTVGQFEHALNDLQSQGAKGFVLDLRDNGGGTLDSTCQMLDPLVPQGPLAMQITADGNTSVLGWSDEEQLDVPMAAITNEYTASAAELFVCDLKDYGKAKQVGTKTYGKGVLQTTRQLPDQSAVKITTAYYNAAKSPNFDGVGLTPDEQVELTDQQSDLRKAGKLSLADDPQYQKAAEVVRAGL